MNVAIFIIIAICAILFFAGTCIICDKIGKYPLKFGIYCLICSMMVATCLIYNLVVPITKSPQSAYILIQTIVVFMLISMAAIIIKAAVTIVDRLIKD